MQIFGQAHPVAICEDLQSNEVARTLKYCANYGFMNVVNLYAVIAISPEVLPLDSTDKLLPPLYRHHSY